MRNRLAGVLSAWVDGDAWSRAIDRVQTTRGRIADLEAAALHFCLLPSREDLRVVRRRVHRVRREMSALEAELERLEAAVEGRR